MFRLYMLGVTFVLYFIKITVLGEKILHINQQF
jgi:hypothetical protein